TGTSAHAVAQPQGAHVTFAMKFEQAQALEHADGCVHRGVRCAMVAHAIPASVRHLLFQQVLRDRVETRVLIPEMGQYGAHHPRDARLAPSAPSIVDTTVPLDPAVEKPGDCSVRGSLQGRSIMEARLRETSRART